MVGVAVFVASTAYSLVVGDDSTDTAALVLFTVTVVLFGAAALLPDAESPLSYAAVGVGWLCLLAGLFFQFRERLDELRHGRAA